MALLDEHAVDSAIRNNAGASVRLWLHSSAFGSFQVLSIVMCSSAPSSFLNLYVSSISRFVDVEA